ncbi:hypothetical protein [Duganella sp. S19_KUP01_CR8]|uniref:hypothetical protein n=1 Tax=Duganella sp. S19_KUP01_CR8 TaxID=3025502 RepID=UPI002FCDB363
MSSKLLSLLAGLCAVLLAGCATTADTDSAVPAQASAGKSCRSSEPATGTSIRRRECSNDGVQTVTQDDLREYRRESTNVGGK